MESKKGDGAETLARDAGISREKAYRIMKEQGHSTYKNDDGVVKSDIDPGDVVQVSNESSGENSVGIIPNKDPEVLNTNSLQNDKLSGVLTAGSLTLGATGNNIGRHMQSLSRFRPMQWNNGPVYRPALRGYRYGPLSGAFASKLGSGLRIGGNVLGGLGIAYSGYNMYHGNISKGKGSLDIGFGIVGFLGPLGLGVATIYFIGDTFIPGGWEATPQHMYKQIQRNSYDGVWISPYNHSK